MRLVVLASLLFALACEREDRPFSWLQPERPGTMQDGKQEATGAAHVVRNAYAVSEGQRLFDSFNCSGCHGGRGGGHIGPALTDAAWRYGSSVEQIHQSIAGGRPGGMPAFGGLVTDPQIWQLSAYVMSLSGRVPQDVGAGRPDGIAHGEPPVMHTEQTPKPEQVNR